MVTPSPTDPRTWFVRREDYQGVIPAPFEKKTGGLTLLSDSDPYLFLPLERLLDYIRTFHSKKYRDSPVLQFHCAGVSNGGGTYIGFVPGGGICTAMPDSPEVRYNISGTMGRDPGIITLCYDPKMPKNDDNHHITCVAIFR